MACLTNMDYYTKFLVVTLTPFGVLLALVLFFLLPGLWIASKDFSDQANHRRLINLATRKFIKLVIFTAFLLYPGVSSVVFGYFQYRTVDGVKYMLWDFTLIFADDKWFQLLPVAIIMVLIYPLGVPALFFTLLYRYQSVLWLPETRVKFGFLYEAYADYCWWFEILDMTNKLILTSVLAFFQTEAQLLVGWLWAGVYLLICLLVRPYLRKGEDRLLLFAQVEILMLILSVTVLNATVTGDELPQSVDVAMSVLLIAMTLGFICSFLWMAFVTIRKICERRSAAAFQQAQYEAEVEKMTEESFRADRSNIGSPSGVPFPVTPLKMSASQFINSPSMHSSPMTTTTETSTFSAKDLPGLTVIPETETTTGGGIEELPDLQRISSLSRSDGAKHQRSKSRSPVSKTDATPPSPTSDEKSGLTGGVVIKPPTGDFELPRSRSRGQSVKTPTSTDSPWTITPKASRTTNAPG